jgi:hypothetical protein
MATAKPIIAAPRRRRWLKVLLSIAIVVALLLAWFWRPLRANAVTAASYGAHVACSCRYIGGRSLQDCRKDFEPGMGPVTLSEDAEAKSVTARYLLFARQTATFRQGQGCMLEPWQD